MSEPEQWNWTKDMLKWSNHTSPVGTTGQWPEAEVPLNCSIHWDTCLHSHCRPYIVDLVNQLAVKEALMDKHQSGVTANQTCPPGQLKSCHT